MSLESNNPEKSFVSRTTVSEGCHGPDVFTGFRIWTRMHAKRLTLPPFRRNVVDYYRLDIHSFRVVDLMKHRQRGRHRF